jgi:hypothetical protein
MPPLSLTDEEMSLLRELAAPIPLRQRHQISGMITVRFKGPTPKCGRLDEHLVRWTFLRTSGGRGRRTGHKQAPSRRPRHIVFARPLVVAHRNAPKQTEDRARGLVQLRVFRPLGQNGPKHQAKKTPLPQGEFKIGETDTAEPIAPARARLHRCCQFPEPFRGDRRKKMLLVGKMAIDGCRGHSDAARSLPQANAVRAGFIQDRPRRRA